MSINWKELVRDTASDTAKLISGGFRRHLPNIGATDAQVLQTEQFLGFQLNHQYKEFLMEANGWKEFGGTADLFGTTDFSTVNGLLSYATRGLYAFNEDGHFPPEELEPGRPSLAPELDSVENEDVLPIGVSTWYASVVLIGKNIKGIDGQVFHVLGSAVNRYKDFLEFFTHYREREHSKALGL